MNEKFLDMCHKITIITDKATYEKDFASLAQLIEWRNDMLDKTGFTFADMKQWLRSKGISEDY
jgi:hypothetical protein